MSVVHEFMANRVRISESEKTVFMSASPFKETFKYDIYCRRDSVSYSLVVHMFFNLDSKMCLIVQPRYTDLPNSGRCFLSKFWLEDDSPVISSWLFTTQEVALIDTRDQFKEQYASYLLDNIINQ
jgi:hypothetical protein